MRLLVAEDDPRGAAGRDIVPRFSVVEGSRGVMSELASGTDPLMTVILRAGFTPGYGSGDDVIRLAIGENWVSDGELRARSASEQCYCW